MALITFPLKPLHFPSLASTPPPPPPSPLPSPSCGGQVAPVQPDVPFVPGHRPWVASRLPSGGTRLYARAVHQGGGVAQVPLYKMLSLKNNPTCFIVLNGERQGSRQRVVANGGVVSSPGRSSGTAHPLCVAGRRSQYGTAGRCRRRSPAAWGCARSTAARAREA